MKIYHRIEFLAVAVAVCVGLAMEHPSLLDSQLAHAAKVTATSYNDGFVVGKNDCRSRNSYSTTGHTTVWINGYNAGWKSAGCMTHTVTATSYNDGFVVGKNDCRSRNSYSTTGHTTVWINVYNVGWKSAGCRLQSS